ncbi:MAG: glycosyltransferase family 4 protein [Deltaproteobacteria bacterium]|nr:glycosyltransferase family 4 protein [Deltaproteobacteria bacterium]
MKIGLVCKYFLSSKGGLERDTMMLAEELAKRDHEVHVFCYRGEHRAGVTVHPVPMIPFASPAKNISFAIMASHRCSTVKLDVVQSMERIWSQDIYRTSDSINPIQMETKYPNRIIRSLKAAGPRRQALSLLDRRIFHKGGAKLILAISNLVKEQIMTHYRVPEEKIVVIYNSVDTTRFNPFLADSFKGEMRKELAIKPGEKVILFMGNNYKLKGLPLLLEALTRIKDRSFVLVVAGTDLTDPYRHFANQHHIGGQVRFIGHYEYPERLYAAADIFLFPSHGDTFGNVCLEAMACGVPVIVSRTAGASEIIDHGLNGYVLRTGESEELAARIKESTNPENHAIMSGEAARKAAEFTIDRHMDQLFALYERIRELKDRERQ